MDFKNLFPGHFVCTISPSFPSLPPRTGLVDMLKIPAHFKGLISNIYTICKRICIYKALFPLLKALYSTCHIHPFIQWWRRLPCKVPTAHQERFGETSTRYLAQPGGAGIRTRDLPMRKVWVGKWEWGSVRTCRQWMNGRGRRSWRSSRSIDSIKWTV